MSARSVWTPDDGPPETASVGGKGQKLAVLAGLAAAHGFLVPRFVVLRAEAFEAIAAPVARGQGALEARRAAVRAVALPEDLRAEILSALDRNGLANRAIAVRSSAAAEDGVAASFAGQFDSVLGVPAADRPELWDAIRRVWASTLHEHAAAYAERGATDPMRMAVVLQELVEPAVSGVAFSADPVTGDRDTAVVSAVYGLGEGLVSGELDADTYHVARDGVVHGTIAHKDRAVRAYAAGGTGLVPVDEAARDRPALHGEEARRIAACVRAIAEVTGTPQDVEWALVGDAAPRELVLLQTRPITTLGVASSTGTVSRPHDSGESSAPSPRLAPPAAARIWDNSNIVESYSGVTTPLTFSFARGVYEDVYRQFCRVMGVSESLIASHGPVFANLLGLVRGRVYYNLLHWYRTLALLPGFTFNRSFMERMMGVREALEDPPPPPSAGSRLRDFFSLLRMLAALIREHGKLAREVPRFHARVEASLAPVAQADLATWSEPELVGLYRRLEHELLRHWRPPLVNDFFAMIFFGVLSRLIAKWLPGAPVTLANDLLCGEGGIISTEPARRVMELARAVRASPPLAAAFAAEPHPHALLARLRANPESAPFAREIDAYIARFGDRCLEELKLETVTLREDPRFLIGMIRAYAERGSDDAAAQAAREATIRAGAEALVRAQLRGARRAVFFFVLRRARRRVRDRENLRFERTRVFGVVRRLLLGLGARFAARGRIEAPRDVFWLTIEEALGEAEGTLARETLGPRIVERRARFEAWERGPAPPERFETHGAPEIVFGAESAEPTVEATRAATAGRELRGTGCCPGVVRERVRIVRDPREPGEVAGRILVAERTDPGWTLLFPAVRGLLVQRGSLLSHSAIVAREMGIPCIVGIPSLLDTLNDGEWVEMDGATGIVLRDAESAR